MKEKVRKDSDELSFLGLCAEESDDEKIIKIVKDS